MSTRSVLFFYLFFISSDPLFICRIFTQEALTSPCYQGIIGLATVDKSMLWLHTLHTYPTVQLMTYLILRVTKPCQARYGSRFSGCVTAQIRNTWFGIPWSIGPSYLFPQALSLVGTAVSIPFFLWASEGGVGGAEESEGGLAFYTPNIIPCAAGN